MPCGGSTAYHNYVSRKAPGRDRFFVTTRQGGNPVVKSTISAWVVKLIRRAYENATEQDARLSSTSVHEIRALAASLAVQATFSITDVLKAATWATPTTFATYYLRDVSGIQEKLHVLSPCVVAGQLFR